MLSEWLGAHTVQPKDRVPRVPVTQTPERPSSGVGTHMHTSLMCIHNDDDDGGGGDDDGDEDDGC